MMAVLCHVAFSAAVTSLVSSERSSDAPPLDQLLRDATGATAVLQDSAFFRRVRVQARPPTRGLSELNE